MPLDAVIGSPACDFDSKPVAAVSITAKKQSYQKTKMKLPMITQQSNLKDAGIGNGAKRPSSTCSLHTEQIMPKS
eukprot:13826758-Ditylum_brightwellii.AAC.1